MPRSGMPGAFRNGMVEVQQGLDSEVLQIGSGKGFALLDFQQSRERLNK
jgi:hypothetical protein